MRLVKTGDLSPVGWPPGQVGLKQVSAIVTAATNIYTLIQENGIAPDSAAFALIYDLNPTVRDANSIAANTQLQLPCLADERLLQQIRNDGELVELTVDPELHRELDQRIEALQVFSSSLSRVTSDSGTQSQLSSLLNWYQQIERRFKRRTDPPLRHATLVELQNEADLLNSLLQGAIQRQHELGSDEKQQVAAIFEDVSREVSQYGQVLAGSAPKAQGYYSVTVNVKGISAALSSSLRVYYTYNGLYRSLPAQPPLTCFGFKQLGPGQSENLLMKNYWVWAAKDGDANHPLTQPFLLRIDETTPTTVTVDLSFNGGVQR
jgi:hypothetical protein